MDALVGYSSSDDEEEKEEDVLPQRPAKVAKLNHNAPEHLTAPLKTPTAHPEARIETLPLKGPTISPQPQPAPPLHEPTIQPPPQGPAAGPTLPTAAPPDPSPNHPASTSTTTAPSSPYTLTRQRLHDLTMPTVPNFAIPPAPQPPAQNSEAAASLAATTKQFERFLALKKTGVHFNERLQGSTSLRNPALLGKLMAFAGVQGEYESSLEGGLGWPVKWDEDCYVEALVKGNERRERKRGREREGVEFVTARGDAQTQAVGEGSGKSTPGKRSRFDKR